MKEITPIVLWLEAKQVLRGFPSTIFGPELTPQLARKIRGAGREHLAAVMEMIRKEKQEDA